MSWDPNAGGNYDNYGNYDASGMQYQHQQQGQQQGYGVGGNDQSYDMGTGYDSYAPQADQSQAYYNPNAYSQQQQQPQQAQQPPTTQQYQGYNAHNAYRRVPHQHCLTPTAEQAMNNYSGTPTPMAAPPQQQPQQPAALGIPGISADGVNPMVANMAMEYGQNIVGKGQEELKRNLDKYVSIGQLRYYFAVDNTYVGKKLGTFS